MTSVPRSFSFKDETREWFYAPEHTQWRYAENMSYHYALFPTPIQAVSITSAEFRAIADLQEQPGTADTTKELVIGLTHVVLELSDDIASLRSAVRALQGNPE